MADGTLHGVNLTGWLSLEPWVTPELFAEAGALDEDALLKGLGARNYAEVVRRHRNSFITRDDFVRIASRGFNAVRLPVPWYAFGDGAAQTIGFVGCMEHVDDALDWAEELGLKVIFALAINPGGPGRGGEATHDLADMRLSRERALDVVFRLSKRYASRMGFFGIELADDVRLPAPAWADPHRGHARPPAAQLLSRGLRARPPRRGRGAPWSSCPTAAFPAAGAASWPSATTATSGSTATSTGARPRAWMSLAPRGCAAWWSAILASCTWPPAPAGMPVMVGKWSAALPIADSAMTPEGRIALERVFTSEQIAAYEKAPAWFFNTWKTSGLLPGWDARVAMATFERGMIV